jgi:hypothetical protein
MNESNDVWHFYAAVALAVLMWKRENLYNDQSKRLITDTAAEYADMMMGKSNE